MLSNRSRVLTVGVTCDLAHQVASHDRRRGGTRLVYYQRQLGIAEALERKAELEALTQPERRALLEVTNPTWRNLMEEFDRPRTSNWAGLGG